MSIFSSSRCVLIMGDEGLQVFMVSSRKSNLLEFLPWEAEDFELNLSKLLVRKCKRAPVVVFNDMVEQHYRKETIPKANYFDRENIKKRRLNVAFPNYKIRAALKLKDNKATRSDKKAGAPYLFAAIPMSNSFNKVLKAVTLSGAPILGFYLLPIEAAAMVKDISHKLNRNKKHKPTWAIFAGQHHNGGLRQIVTRNGELALTRLSPIVDTDVEPDLWAKEVASELDATMSYLSRFGYKQADGLDVVVIANDSAKEVLESVVNVEGELSVLTSTEAANLVNTNIGKQEEYRYADVFHAAYLGKKKIYKLPLESAAITEVIQPRRVASFVTLGLVLGICYLGYMAFHNWHQMASKKDQYIVSNQKVQALKQEYDIELEKKKALGFDLKLVSNSIDIYNKSEPEKMTPLAIVRAIDLAIGVDTHLDKLMFTLDEVQKPADQYSYDSSSGGIDKQIVAVMIISFPSSMSLDAGVQRVNAIVQNLKLNLPDAQVNVLRQVGGLSYTENVTGESRAASQGAPTEDYVAEIEIRRPLK